jgi:hypothetical protein
VRTKKTPLSSQIGIEIAREVGLFRSVRWKFGFTGAKSLVVPLRTRPSTKRTTTAEPMEAFVMIRKNLGRETPRASRRAPPGSRNGLGRLRWTDSIARTTHEALDDREVQSRELFGRAQTAEKIVELVFFRRPYHGSRSESNTARARGTLVLRFGRWHRPQC